MKDEEMAEEEYKLAEEVIKPIYRNAIQNDESFAKYGVNCYLAGLKAGRPQWHDLRKDPNDLPKNSPYFSGESVRVIGAIPLSEDKYILLECRYFYSEKKWKTQEDRSVVKVIAWCEIPTFDKE